MPLLHTHRRHHAYSTRVLACLVAALLLAIGLVRFWPTWDRTPEVVYSSRGTEAIQIEEIQPTSQSQEKKPPPPAPLPPVVVPNDAIVEDDPIEFEDANLIAEEVGEDEVDQEGVAEASAARRPDTNARLLRYVEPDYTRAARRNEVRARVVVEVQVNADGQVEDAAIVDRVLLDEQGQPREQVSQLGYGLEEAALSAARRCLFRPAEANGDPVSTRTTLTISFGT